MILTEQCKEDFEDWIRPQSDKEERGKSYHSYNPYFFYKLPFSMQYGVLVDFFTSEEIYITIINEIDFIGIGITPNDYTDYRSKTLNEARTKAIEKANEIYNNEIHNSSIIN